MTPSTRKSKRCSTAVLALAVLACCSAPAFAASPWAILKNPVIKRGYNDCVEVATATYWETQGVFLPKGYRGCAVLVPAWRKATKEGNAYLWALHHRAQRHAIRAAVAAMNASGTAPINWAKFKKATAADAKKAAQ